MRVYRSGTSVSVPTDLNLTELLLTSARAPPLTESHLIAKDDLEGRSLSLGQLRSHAGRLAHGLTSAEMVSEFAICKPDFIIAFS